jgi:glyoxylase-like metal-dependent hydrolase (beta-lactamase superfamily II)
MIGNSRATILAGLAFAAFGFSAVALAGTPEFEAAKAKAEAAMEAQWVNPVMNSRSIRITDNAYVIQGYPNVGIIVGSKGALVVDTGAGTKNGEMVLKEAERRMPKGGQLYLTTTSNLPPYATGASAFPASVKYVRCKAQQEQSDADDVNAIAYYQKNPMFKDLLNDVKPRKPDITFDSTYEVDLGTVHVKLFCFPMSYGKGDVAVFAEEDRALWPGALMIRETAPDFLPGSSLKGWFAAIDTLAALHPYITVPAHGEMYDYNLPRQTRLFLQDLQTRALALKSEGKKPEEAGKILNAEFKKKYPDWHLNDLTRGIARIYAEAQ